MGGPVVVRDITVFAGDPGSIERLKALHRSVARAVARIALAQGLNRDDLTGYFD